MRDGLYLMVEQAKLGKIAKSIAPTNAFRSVAQERLEKIKNDLLMAAKPCAYLLTAGCGPASPDLLPAWDELAR
ncbi:hypothetical protein GGQ88_003559 [Novosphingobium hassiacum]|uniref:Uncharacterized protein n=1 Tax=Novosphingobium hassiacum TaxID=173676 RepID=A0A7W6EXG3_9SPHN|nr:hypothetical protein [Novosphingobium hassiacum]MBB3862261.1 hypothetical protein [Novosphingobium hassiacum]